MAPGDADHIAGSLKVPENDSRRYDLPALIDLAQRSNAETRGAWELARQAALAAGLLDSSYAPQIAIEAIGGVQRTPLPIPSTLVPNGYFTADTREVVPMLTLKWLLFDFGRRGGLRQAARANSFVANVAFTGAHQKVMFATSRAYFALGAARGRLQAARQAVETAVVVQQATEAKRDQGLATIVAVTQAQRATAQARFSLARATGAERTAYADLIAAIGVPPSTHFDIEDSSQRSLPAQPQEDIDACVQDALANRPDVIAALGQIQAAEGTLKGERSAYFPTITLGGQLFQNIGSVSADGSPYYHVNRPGANVLLELSVPLFDGGLRADRVALAHSRLSEAHDNLDHVREVAAQQVVNAYDDLKTSLAEYSAAISVKKAAATAYDAALFAFQQGVGNYPDLASAQTGMADADAELEDAHANVYTAAAALAFATGTIGSTS